MNKRILTIEDDITIARLERDYLSLSDFDVDIITNGKEGLECALCKDYSLILLDLMLPGIDGLEILKKIRAEKDIPILIVSARKNDLDKIRGLGLGADDYITKPFSPNELVARVKAHLSRYERFTGNAQQKAPENDIIEIDDLTIDKTARRVFVNGEEKILTVKEFDLLAFLAENPEHVYTKEELYAKVWNDIPAEGNPTVTVHVKKIREKLEGSTHTSKYIGTVWGVGYRFKV